MPFSYLLASSTPLRQGEIIENLFELRPVEEIDVGQTAKVERVDHKRLIVITQDCDLDWDYKARQGQAPEHKLLTHALFCDLFTPDEIKVRTGLKSEQWRRVRSNEDARYHYLHQAHIGETDQGMPELCADFKLLLSLPVEFVYSLTRAGHAVRKCILPDLYLQDLIQRLYSFLGRVAIPELE